jgi:hypothetical protein
LPYKFFSEKLAMKKSSQKSKQKNQPNGQDSNLSEQLFIGGCHPNSTKSIPKN